MADSLTVHLTQHAIDRAQQKLKWPVTVLQQVAELALLEGNTTIDDDFNHHRISIARDFAKESSKKFKSRPTEAVMFADVMFVFAFNFGDCSYHLVTLVPSNLLVLEMAYRYYDRSALSDPNNPLVSRWQQRHRPNAHCQNFKAEIP